MTNNTKNVIRKENDMYPPRFRSAEEVKKLVEGYFAHCEATKETKKLRNGDIKIRYGEACSIIGLRRWLNISRQTFYNYLEGVYQNTVGAEEGARISAVLNDARDRIEELTVSRALSGDYDAKTATLLLNGFGYTQKQEETGTNEVLIKIQGASDEQAQKWAR